MTHSTFLCTWLQSASISLADATGTLEAAPSSSRATGTSVEAAPSSDTAASRAATPTRSTGPETARAGRIRALLDKPEEDLTERERAEVMSIYRLKTIKAHYRLVQAVLTRLETGGDLHPLADVALRLAGNNGL